MEVQIEFSNGEKLEFELKNPIRSAEETTREEKREKEKESSEKDDDE